jgi:hypothetical protein
MTGTFPLPFGNQRSPRKMIGRFGVGPGPVDGFDQDQHASKADNLGVAFGGLFTAHRDTPEKSDANWDERLRFS